MLGGFFRSLLGVRLGAMKMYGGRFATLATLRRRLVAADVGGFTGSY